MQIRLSWFPLTILNVLYRWRRGREKFYRIAAKTVAFDRVVSLLALVTLLAGVACLATRPFTIAGPYWGLLVLLAPLAWQREQWRMLLHLGMAVALVSTFRSLSAHTIAIIVANLVAAALVVIEQRHRRRWMFKPMYLGNTNIGSAGLLRGRVAVAHLFLASRQSWSTNQIRKSMNRAHRATRWLSKEGRRFGASVDFSHSQIDVKNEYWIAEVPNLKNGYAGIREFELFLARQLAAADWRKDASTSDDSAANRCLLVHIVDWTNERAYAQPAISGRTDGRLGVEYAVVGANDSAATIAHELLHLFGADDYYFNGQFTSGSHAGQIGEWLDAARFGFLRRCVMFCSGATLRELAVDDQTAQKIGWL